MHVLPESCGFHGNIRNVVHTLRENQFGKKSSVSVIQLKMSGQVRDQICGYPAWPKIIVRK